MRKMINWAEKKREKSSLSFCMAAICIFWVVGMVLPFFDFHENVFSVWAGVMFLCAGWAVVEMLQSAVKSFAEKGNGFDSNSG